MGTSSTAALSNANTLSLGGVGDVEFDIILNFSRLVKGDRDASLLLCLTIDLCLGIASLLCNDWLLTSAFVDFRKV